ncbi:class I SAM-dependent methyltransferase [Deltaproteobacteria bacterium]|nr:class I SAM-dependent methyltransferase [Deltaproteobacteria bacterium]
MKYKDIEKCIIKVADFYDRKKVGDIGPLGFRRSTDLTRLSLCIDELIDQKILVPGESLFLDMGCGDGRVNVLFSYLVKRSIGIELDEWTLDEYAILKKELEASLEEDDLPLPPHNISLFHGDSMEESLHESIYQGTGLSFKDFDLFYTYLTMHDEFADLIAHRAKKGSVFMVYGLDKITPEFQGLELLTDAPLQGILAIYRKTYSPE